MTPLPPDAPRIYAKAQLGERTIAWMRRRGFIDNRTVQPITRIARDGRGEEGK